MMPVDEFRRTAAERSLAPPDAFSGLEIWNKNRLRQAEEILQGAWTAVGYDTRELTVPIAWSKVCADNRSREFNLYSWDPIAPVLVTFHHTSRHEYLRYALNVAIDWFERHDSLDSPAPFAWYDMAIGIRAYRLAYLIDACARWDGCTDDELAQLMQLVRLHQQALTDDANFAAHSNHGFYFAAGQLAMAKRLPMLPAAAEHARQGEERVELLLENHFTSEGVHREHSPYYHRMVMETFAGLLQAGLLTWDRWAPRLEAMQESLAWFVRPDNYLAMFGDTPQRHMRKPDPDGLTSPALLFTYTNGRRGRPPVENWRYFPEAGYVVFRDGWPSGEDDQADWSYLAQTGAFHSRTHKHADDLSFVWHEHGQELLIDPGRFGYLDPITPDTELGQQGFYYGHPKRVYVESTKAHNTVEIDGKSYPRRGVKPYGSALRDAGEWGGIYYSEAEVRQFKTIRHRRLLLYRPREWLVVTDWLHDNLPNEHRFTQRFHFAPEVEVSRTGSAHHVDLLLEAPALHVKPLLLAEALPVSYGQADPSLLGWIARKDNHFAPCWSIGYEATRARSGQFATLFAFGSEPVTGPSSMNGSGRKLDLRWRQGSFSHRVNLVVPEDGTLALDYSIAGV